MCWRPLQVLLRKPSGPSCEIVSDLCPKSFSHDWHVQPNFQRPNHDPPERGVFSPVGLHLVRIRPSSKLYKHTVQHIPSQRMHPTEFPPHFHNGNDSCGYSHTQPRQRTIERTRDGMRLPPCKRLKAQAVFRPCEGGRQKVDKRTYFGGPCFEGTLQEPALARFPNRSLVAEANFSGNR
jgi:hypothetical protein